MGFLHSISDAFPECLSEMPFSIFYQSLTQATLQHPRVAHRHLAVHDGKSEGMAVGSHTQSGKGANAIGVRESARLCKYLSPRLLTTHLTCKSAIDTRHGKVAQQRRADVGVRIALAQHRRKGSWRQAVVGAESATVVNDKAWRRLIELLGKETPEIIHS